MTAGFRKSICVILSIIMALSGFAGVECSVFADEEDAKNQDNTCLGTSKIATPAAQRRSGFSLILPTTAYPMPTM